MSEFRPLPAGRNGLDPAYVRNHQRMRLITAARSIINEGGYKAATVEAIVSRARVTRPKFYQFWSNRAACIVDALVEGPTEMLTGIDELDSCGWRLVRREVDQSARV